MSLTFADVARIDQRLAEDGRVADPEALATKAEAWLTGLCDQGRPTPVSIEDLLRLCACARARGHERAGRLAAGALKLLLEDDLSTPGAAQFVSRLALERIRALTGEVESWTVKTSSESEERLARQLFEIAKDDSSYEDDALIEGARRFIDDHRCSSGMFGRMAYNLEILLRIFADGTASSDSKRIARAALTYFVVVDDAVPDDRGPAGLVDDCVVVRHAVEDLCPERRVITAMLDEIVKRWPFVRSASFGHGKVECLLSEFFIATSGMALDHLLDRRNQGGTAVVVSSARPLAFICSIIVALARIEDMLDEATPLLFESRERLANAETGAEIEFDAYGRLDEASKTFTECDARRASHFRFTEGNPSSTASRVLRIRPIEDIRSFRRSASTKDKLKRGEAVSLASTVGLGPLERLFGRIDPIVLPRNLGRIICVGPVATTRDIAEVVTLFGTPLRETLPMGHLKHQHGALAYEPWSPSHAASSLLRIARTPVDARADLQQSQVGPATVVSAVRPDSTDAATLVKIGAEGGAVLALVEERDDEARDTLAAAKFDFWFWDQRWLKALHWPDDGGKESHPFALRDRAVRQTIANRLNPQCLELQGLSEASAVLRELRRATETGENDVLDSIIGDAMSLLLLLCRSFWPLDRDASLDQAVNDFRRRLDTQKAWLSDWHMRQARECADELARAAAAAASSNPKFHAILEWLSSHEEPVVFAPRAMNSKARAHLEGMRVVVDHRLQFGEPPKALLIPAWFGRRKMERLLEPPAGLHTELLLYSPEWDWFDAAKRRSDLRGLELRRLASERPPLRCLLRPTPVVSGVSRDGESGHTDSPPEPDELVWTGRRARIQADLKHVGGELVDARLVRFAGGAWAAFTATHRVLTVTELLDDARSADAEGHGIASIVARYLSTDEVVLVLRGSDRDALREAVDAVAPAGTRREAGEWQRALRRYRGKLSSVDSLAADLARSGCQRERSTIERWLEDDTMIAPRRGEQDIRAILKATDDASLRSNLERCIDAVEKLRSLHLKVAHRMAKRVLGEVRQWLEVGTRPDDLVQIDERLVIVTVESIDPRPMRLPVSAVNRLQEDS